ncbi:MAG TPA: DEDD exonuclease domain-containing protein [Acidimicrobiia bacterium]|nr:DEDD exonuclease domain-containing protein [Acidimicrobiia bacterium]
MAAPASSGVAVQRGFDDLGTPLHDVTFVVVDLETTGGSPATCSITEVGAVKYRGGECLGELHTLVNPGVAIPPLITVLTGITEAMVIPAPPIDEVLPPLLEFLGPSDTTVLGGHNVRFDVSFLDAALTARGYPRLAHRRVDTAALARRLVRDEVPNLRLATLARHLRVPTEPAHRALPDARATLEVLHALLERAGRFGVLGLDDLLELPHLRAHPSAGKLALTARLPRGPGVYLFKDRAGRVLYVGKASNLRSRVRSYFSGDTRRKVPQLLRETEAIDHRPCAHPLEAAVRELRLIRELQPRFNRRLKTWRSYAYLRLTLGERFPRLAVVRTASSEAGLHVGPLSSVAAAQLLRDAVETAIPLRRCRRRIGVRAELGGPPCLAAQLHVAACPCSGATPEDQYAAIVERARRALTGDADILLTPLERRLASLVADERFEEAASVRDQLAAIAGAFERQRLVDGLCRAGRFVVDGPDGRVEIDDGRVVLPDDPPTLGVLLRPAVPARDEIDELLEVARWLRRRATALRVVSISGTLASPRAALPRYAPRRRELR